MADAYIEGNLYYTYLFDQKDKFDRYSCAVSLEGDQVKKAKQLKLPVKQDDNKFNGMAYVQLKSNYQPDLYNKDGSEYDGPKMLGEGTTGVVKVTQRPYNNKFGEGVTTFIAGVKFTNTVEYKSPNAAFDDETPNDFQEVAEGVEF
jgi:hypothetical protein|tara:strand:+ start:1798 stop:2235 length:438 start_codon:yes stop_codon:yes gene_type:complete